MDIIENVPNITFLYDLFCQDNEETIAFLISSLILTI